MFLKQWWRSDRFQMKDSWWQRKGRKNGASKGGMMCKIVASKTLCKHRKIYVVQHKNQKCSIFQINNGHNTWTITCIIVNIRTRERCQGQHWLVRYVPWCNLKAWCSVKKRRWKVSMFSPLYLFTLTFLFKLNNH
jgi:hypothetical protein